MIQYTNYSNSSSLSTTIRPCINIHLGSILDHVQVVFYITLTALPSVREVMLRQMRITALYLYRHVIIIAFVDSTQRHKATS